jgi:hypothetical protein
MRSLLVASAFVLLLSQAAHAQAVPVQVPVAMRISDGAGPIDRDVTIRFSLHSAPEAGSQLWIEPAKTVTSVEGFVSHTLGLDAGAPLPAAIFNGNVLYLEVVIDNVLMQSRLPVRSVPYALRAGTAGAADRATVADRATLADRATAADGAALAQSLGLATTPEAQRVKIDAQGRVGLGANPSSDRLNVNGNVAVTGGVAVTGNVVAEPTYAVSPRKTDGFETTSRTFVNVTGVEVTITTHGKPVMLSVVATYQSIQIDDNYVSWAALDISRNGNRLGAGNGITGASDTQQEWGQDPMSFTYVDVPPAGTHTYRLMLKSGEGTRIRLVNDSVTQLAAVELN